MGDNMKYYIKREIHSHHVVIKYFPKGLEIGNKKLSIRKIKDVSSIADTYKKGLNNLYRAKEVLINLIRDNITENAKFWTYTFADNVTDVSQANFLFTKFLKRLKYKLGFAPPYVAVPEIQHRRAENFGFDVIHYHVVFLDLDFFEWETMLKTWGNGSAYVKSITTYKEGWRDGVALYIAKYLSKDFINEKGKKSYFCSRGLKRPHVSYHTDYELLDYNNATFYNTAFMGPVFKEIIKR